MSIGNTVLKLGTRMHSAVYRASAGKVWGTMFGAPVLLLQTKGRKSGVDRTTPLLYLKDGDDFVVVASAGGTPKHPAWWLNLKANPQTTVEVEGREVPVKAEEADPEERARLWPKLVEMYASYEDYQKKTDREIPVGILHPTG